MKKSLIFLLYFIMMCWLMIVCFGGTVIMMSQGGIWMWIGATLTLVTIGLIPHFIKFLEWAQKELEWQ